MDSDQAVGLFQRGREFFQRNARRIRRQHRIGLHARFDVAVNLVLGLDVFEYGLDHDVGSRHPVAGHVRDQPVQRCIALRRGSDSLRIQLVRALERIAEVFRFAVLQGYAKSA